MIKSLNILLLTHTSEQWACFEIIDKLCVSIDQMEDSYHNFACWGSFRFKFHHVFVSFTLTESLMGPRKKLPCSAVNHL